MRARMSHPTTEPASAFVVARIAYLAGEDARVGYRVWPPSSGRPVENPPKEFHERRVWDCRPIAAQAGLDDRGFRLLRSPSAIADFYDEVRVRERYYPEV